MEEKNSSPRALTQSLATVVFGDDSMLSRYENLDGEQAKRFYLQYIFPPFSVGEVTEIGRRLSEAAS